MPPPVTTNSSAAFHENGPVELRARSWPIVLGAEYAVVVVNVRDKDWRGLEPCCLCGSVRCTGRARKVRDGTLVTGSRMALATARQGPRENTRV